MDRLGRWLELAANAAIVIAAGFIIAIAYRQYSAPPLVTGPPPKYIAGDILPSVSASGAGDQAERILLFVHSDCQYCTQSMPFFSKVIEERNRRRAHLQIVALSLQPEDALKTYLAKYSLAVDASATVTQDQWKKLSLTPTVLFVGKDNRVQRVWTGLMSPAAQEELLGILNSKSDTSN